MTDNLKLIIGKNIKKYREFNNETSVELADAINSSQSIISDWENGKKMPRAGSIEKLAQHWNIPKSKILSEPSKYSPGIETIAAHLNDDVTPEQLEKITEYIDFITKDNKKD